MKNLQNNNDLDSSYISDLDDISPIFYDSNDIFLTNNSSIIESNDDRVPQSGPKADKVWNYYIKKNETSDGHYSTQCYHCKNSWSRGKLVKLKAHLTNECLQCPKNIRKYWQEKLISEKNNYKRIPFEVIENPFIIDFFHELNPGFTPPSRFTLSGRLLDQEISRINLKIDKELETSNNLTLTLDGWTSKRNESLYNYIISTLSRKEYLIALKNYSSRSQTGEFLTNEISTIVENIGSEKFAAVVTDAGSVCRIARKKTQEMYSHIWNIRCITHSLNLIVTNLVKLDEIKQYISDCGKIIKFFNNSHQANSILRQGHIEMKIKSKGLKTWIKIKWGSLYMTTDSILQAKLVFDWILTEHPNIITNLEVINLIKNDNFFIICNQIQSVWTPIKMCINVLESNTTILADCGPKADKVWNYYIKKNETSDGHYSTQCYHCKNSWSRGKLVKLKAHLTNECLQCPKNIRKYWQEKLISEKNNYKRIPFEVIENPFIIDFFHELNPGFTPPSRFTLSGRLLDQEISRINLKIDKELETSNNLTLTLDGWTSKRNESLYNYIISTLSRKEYLIALKNYSSRSQTGEFLTNEISTIVENIGSEKFAAVVTDAGSVCRIARKKTQEMYSHIWNIRCITHSLNLIVTNLVKLDEIKQYISDCGKIIKFFNNSHQANSILRQGHIEMKIKSKGLKTWIKIKWGSLYMTTDSILQAKLVFDWILTEHPNIITNLEVINLIKNDNFFIICNQIQSVWTPIKMCINVLESNTTILADCFIYIIKLTIAIYRLSNLNSFKTPAIRIFNQRYMEFQHPAYLLCYFLHPLYRANSILRQGHIEMKIKSKGLKTWIKIKWGSLYMTTDSILQAKLVFDWILTEHPNIITNLEVINLIKNDNFFIICNQIQSVWTPIKMCINVLESNTTILADCFIYIIKLTIAIYRLSNLNSFKTPAIRIFNQRYMEFQHPAYLLCYFLHPLYRGRGLHNGIGFRKVVLIASKI
ncbi:hypothetical protein Glove_279g1 [Diversispora epigaea]|uniref:DUF659 domain-containing protein n=1 Tax=Diversispora epigaea TaxID=1348612 RepID=A0A397I654_9GLOM|nr:hypothetical protein Glove_279g1 [Diversispora epigaea]